jgi:pimeloyl-ACP methyl ester carboxylesterase
MMELRNGRISLHLSALRVEAGPKLLLLHELGGGASDWDAGALAWRGGVYALDLSGHGRSGRVFGGSYSPELWAADADAALALLEQAVVVGRGVSAYVALLLAGARGDAVPAAILMPGAGLASSGRAPSDEQWHWRPIEDPATTPPARGLQPVPGTDPAALISVRSDIRPDDYAAAFACASRRLLLLEDGSDRPSWWRQARSAKAAQVVGCDLNAALQRLG